MTAHHRYHPATLLLPWATTYCTSRISRSHHHRINNIYHRHTRGERAGTRIPVSGICVVVQQVRIPVNGTYVDTDTPRRSHSRRAAHAMIRRRNIISADAILFPGCTALTRDLWVDEPDGRGGEGGRGVRAGTDTDTQTYTATEKETRQRQRQRQRQTPTCSREGPARARHACERTPLGGKFSFCRGGWRMEEAGRERRGGREEQRGE
jgi:hypothetical protein